MLKKDKNPGHEDYSNMIDRKKDFKGWFKQVFLYHYKWYVLIGVVIVATLVFLTVDSANKKEYDLTYVTATIEKIESAPVESLRKEVEAAVTETAGDINGDGEILVNNDFCQLGEAVSVNSSEAYFYKLLASFNSDDYVMYIVDKQVLDLYTKDKDPVPFSAEAVAIYTGKDDGALAISLDESPVLKDTEFVGDEGLYVCLRPQPQDDTRSVEEYYSLYFKIIDRLLGKS